MKQSPYAEILEEIETGLWEHDIRVEENDISPYYYTDKTFRACIKIFMSGIIWKLWENLENKSLKEKMGKAENLGKEIRSIILKYTGIDAHKLYDADK